MWTLSGNKNQPRYRQIMYLIESKIHQGALLPGERLPAERTLAQQLKVNRSTVVHALDELATRGILIRRQGSGTIVNPDKWGMAPDQKTNWRHYVDQGAFAATSPYLRPHSSPTSTDGKLDLASGELPVELLPDISLPAFSWQDLLAEERYCDIAGYLPLRQTIQAHLSETQGIPSDIEQLLVTSGAQQALFLITQCLLKPGDTIAMESPSYFYALPLFQSAGLRILALPMDKEGVLPDSLIHLHNVSALKMVFLNPTFHNPTGITMSLHRRKALIEICARLHLPIVEDDSYRLLQYSNTLLPPSLKTLDPENVLYIGSLSKITGSMTRIGLLHGPAAVIHRLAEARQEMDFGLSIFPQVLANHIMSSNAFQEHLSFLRGTLKQRRNWLIKAFTETLPDKINFQRPEGGFHLWCHLAGEIPIYRIVNAMREQHILTMPASVFGAKDHAFRLSFIRLNKAAAQYIATELKKIIG